MPTVSTFCPLDCPDACSLEAEVEDGRLLSLGGTRANPLTAGFLCSKVRRFADHVYSGRRILHPGVRRGPKGAGVFEPIGWDQALELVAARMLETRARSGGEALLPLAYGGSNGFLTFNALDALLFQRLGASRLERTVCAAATTAAMTGMYGNMPGTALPDYEHARAIVVWGANPSASNIHLVPVIKRARERGARLAVVDPRRTQLATQADLHVPLRPGTDLPVALALIHELFERGHADADFLARHATGVERLRARAAAWPIERAAREADVPAELLTRLLELYVESSPAVVRCGWGLERNRNGCAAVAAVLALPAVAGKLGVRGGGYTLSNSKTWVGVAQAYGEQAKAPSNARSVNMNRLGRALRELRDPRIELLFVYDNNGLATLPNQEAVRAGLAREDLFTVVFDQVLTDTARYADVVLPATTFLEHEELARSYGALVLQRSHPVISPVGEARSNHAVFAELLRRTGLARPEDPETEEELARRVVSGRDSERVRAELARSGLALPPDGAAPVPFIDVFPDTPDRRIHLVPEHLERETGGTFLEYRPDPARAAFPLALVSPATSRTISSTLGQLVLGHVPLELHPQDAAPRDIATGDAVRVHNELGEVHCIAEVTEAVRPGVVCLPKGLWSHNTLNGATANALCPDSLTDAGGGACFNDARVEVAALAPGKRA